MRLIGLVTPVWGNLLESPEGWVAPWRRVSPLPPTVHRWADIKARKQG